MNRISSVTHLLSNPQLLMLVVEHSVSYQHNTLLKHFKIDTP